MCPQQNKILSGTKNQVEISSTEIHLSVYRIMIHHQIIGLESITGKLLRNRRIIAEMINITRQKLKPK